MKNTTRNSNVSASVLLCAFILQICVLTGFAQPQYVQVGTLPIPSASDRVEVFGAKSQQLFSFPTYNNGYVNDGYVSYQSSNDTFAFTDLPGLAAIYWGRVATDGTNVYSVGGYGNDAYYVDYVPAASISQSPNWQSTTILPNLVYPVGRALHQTFIYKGELYLLGGYHGDGQPLYSDVWYAPILTNGALGSFVQTTSLPIGMASHSATVSADGKVYVAYGTNLFFAQIAADGSIGSWITQPTVAGMNHSNNGNTGMAILNSLLVIVDAASTHVCQLNSSGQLAYTITTVTNPAPFSERSVYVNNGKVYVTATTGNIYRLDGLPTAAPVAETQISAGGNHSLFVKSNGSLWAMGDNRSGELGNGVYTLLQTPAIPEQTVTSNVMAIAAGYHHTIFLENGGSLWAMGENTYGELGDGTFNSTNLPEQIVASNVTAIAAGQYHSLFLKGDGSLWAMGCNVSGQLGDGTCNNTNMPEQIVASDVTAIAAGQYHSLFLKVDGSLWAMGSNSLGQLGNGTYNSTVLPEQIVASNVTAIAAGFEHSLFIKNNGSLWVMGDNTYGELGDGTYNNRNLPEQIVASNVTVIAAAGLDYSLNGHYGGYDLFLKNDGSLWGVGNNGWSQFGDGTTNNINVPEQILPSLAPVFVVQPVNTTNVTGATVTFIAIARSSELARFQWQRNGINMVDGGGILGSSTNILKITGVSGSDSASYSVIVSNSVGSVISSNAALTVIPPARARTGTGAAAFTNGFVIGVSLTDGGSGYTNTPQVRLIGGGGSGAGAYAVVSNGIVTSIIVTNAGYGYTSAPLVVIDPPFVLNPVLGAAPMSFLSFSNLTLGGNYQLQQFTAYYWTNQPLSFTTTNNLYTQMFPGVVGSGDYRMALNPVPSQAFATPEVVDGFVVAATVTSGGSGYVTSPAVTIVCRGGTNATAAAQISGGVVTGINITDAGIGYTNATVIEIAPPPAASVSPTVQPVMRVDSASLAPYDNYQIQSMPTINGTWENWNGGLFIPTGVTNSQYLFITNGTGFFRLQYVP